MYTNQFREYLELKKLQKARNKFHATVKYLNGEVVYAPPVERKYCWEFIYRNIRVVQSTESECYEVMQKEISKHINNMIKRGEMTV